MSSPMQSTNKKFPIWAHALIMLIVAPLTWGLISGALHGFSLPASPIHASTKFSEWLGSSLIALVIGWLSLLFRKPGISWVLMLGLIGFFSYTVHYTEQRLGNVKPGAQPAVQSAQKDAVLVSEAIESFPSFTESMITPDLIRKMELFLVSDAESKIMIRAKEDGMSAKPIGITASSVRFEQNEEKAVITELHYPSNLQSAPNLKMIWWAQNGLVKRVFCLDPTGKEINYRRGNCGRQVAKTFGYSKWYMD